MDILVVLNKTGFLTKKL